MGVKPLRFYDSKFGLTRPQHNGVRFVALVPADQHSPVRRDVVTRPNLRRHRLEIAPRRIVAHHDTLNLLQILRGYRLD
jgi:hypothetical protein